MATPSEYAQQENGRHVRRTAALLAVFVAVFVSFATYIPTPIPPPVPTPDPDRQDLISELKVLIEKAVSAADDHTIGKHPIVGELTLLKELILASSEVELNRSLTAIRSQLADAARRVDAIDRASNDVLQAIASSTSAGIEEHRRKTEELTRTETRLALAAQTNPLLSELTALEVRVRRGEDEQAFLQRRNNDAREQKQFLAAQTSRRQAFELDKVEIESLLKPFITPGHYQLTSSINAWDGETTPDAKPVSLSRLKQLGALDQTSKGLESLYIVGGAKAPGASHDRPLGSFPQYWALQLSKPHILQSVCRAQELLTKHGEALVEQGLLSK